MSTSSEGPTRVPPFVFVRRSSARPWKVATGVLAVMLAVMLALIAQALADRGGSGPPPNLVASGGSATSSTPGAGSSSASTAAGRAAAKVDALIAQSVSDHQSVVAAIGQIGSRTNPTSAATTLSNVAVQRQHVDDQLVSVDWAALSGGRELEAELDAALRASTASDSDYATWGRHVAASGCAAGQSAAQDGAYTAAQASDSSASSAKTQFVEAWNPLASSFGLPTRQASSL